jgi:uncharacterized protein with NRDE domain
MCTAFFVLGEEGAADAGDGAASTSASPPSLALLVLFNRDEFLDRETAAAHFWTPDHPHVLAGRDLRRGGTWVGVTTAGRFALLTNFREPNFSGAGPGAPSRGVLPTDFLTGGQSPLAYLEGLVRAGCAAAHNGFNLVVGQLGGVGGGRAAAQAAYLTNRGPPGAPGHGAPTLLGPGVYGLSNGPLGRCEDGRAAPPQTGWAKVDAGVAALRRLMAAGALTTPAAAPTPAALPWPLLFGASLMGCDTRAPPHALPRTGIPPSIEAALSSTFIPATANLFGHGKGVVYGTRSQTGVAVYGNGRAVLVERSAAVVGDCAQRPSPPPTSPSPVPVAWTEVVHEFVVQEWKGGRSEGGAAQVVVDAAGGCADGPEEEEGLVGGSKS